MTKVKWRRRIRHTSMISALYGMGLAEVYYLPRYGIEWLLGAIMADRAAGEFLDSRPLGIAGTERIMTATMGALPGTQVASFFTVTRRQKLHA